MSGNHVIYEAPLRLLDPLSKLVVLVCTTALAMHWDRPMPLIILLSLLILIGRIGAGMSWSKIGRRIWFIVCFAVPLFVLTTLAAKQAGEVYWEAGSLKLTESAVLTGLTVSIRLFCLFLSSLIYIESTEPKDFVVMMSARLKLPYRFVFGISIAMTFFPLIEAEGVVARESRRLRLGRRPKGLNERLELWRDSLISVFAGAIRRVEQTAGSMDAKGFGAYRNRTYLREVSIKLPGYLVMGMGIMLTIILWSM